MRPAPLPADLAPHPVSLEGRADGGLGRLTFRPPAPRPPLALALPPADLRALALFCLALAGEAECPDVYDLAPASAGRG